MTQMNDANPEIIPEPFNQFWLEVEDGHRIYVEESGNPNGMPIINFHGGPGSQSKPHHRNRFDQQRFRVILFDQRFSGQSTPHAVDAPELLHSFSPQNIVADAEAIRRHLNIERWHVAGSSWGSTMAVLYGVTYPSVTLSLTVRAFFMAQAREWHWLAQGPQLFAPSAYDMARALTQGAEGAAILTAIADTVLHSAAKGADGLMADAPILMPLVQALFAMEYGLELVSEPSDDEGVSVETSPETPPEDIRDTLNCALLYLHTVTHHPMPEGWAVSPKAVAALRAIPIRIVHGAADVLCPIRYAYDFQRAHGHASLVIAPNAGHSADRDGAYKRLYAEALTAL